MAMRVVHLVPALFDCRAGVLGGAERYALELARTMAEVTPTRLVTFGPSDMEQTLGRLKVRVLGRPWRVRGQKHNPFSLRLFRQLREADVIHCHQQHILASSAAAAYARLTGKRVFVSDLGGGGWDISAYLSTDGWYHGHLHLSQYSRKVFGHENHPRARVVWGGVDTSRFRPDRSAAKDGTILYVGRLLPHKGINYLLEAATPDMRIELVGQPYHKAYYQELHRLAQGKCVVFRHDCDDAELVRAYQKACCIVLPSVYRTMYGTESRVPELLGQTLLEGMACGLPAVCTAVASLPEVVEDGVSGFVVPPNDPAALRQALVRLRESPELARKMGEAARQRVLQRFTWAAVVERCLAAYGDCGT